jgi:hypothetical protein
VRLNHIEFFSILHVRVEKRIGYLDHMDLEIITFEFFFVKLLVASP